MTGRCQSHYFVMKTEISAGGQIIIAVITVNEIKSYILTRIWNL